MHGLNLALLVFAAFCAGAFMALLVRALIEDAAQRRLGRETVEASGVYRLVDKDGVRLDLEFRDGGEWIYPPHGYYPTPPVSGSVPFDIHEAHKS